MGLALPPEGRLLTIDINRQWRELAQRHWQAAGLGDRIEARLSPALVELDRLLVEGRAGYFDFAFLDADKLNYPNYCEALLALLRPGATRSAPLTKNFRHKIADFIRSLTR